MDPSMSSRTRTVTRLLAAAAGLALVVVAGEASFSGSVTTSSPVYVVQAGDSLWRIAQIDGLTVAQLAGANNLSTVAWLQPGMVLTIPPSWYVPGSGSSTSASSSESTSSTAESLADSSTADSSTSDSSTAESSTDEPSTAGASTDGSSTDGSSTDGSSTDGSSTDESSTAASSTSGASTDESSTDESSTAASSTSGSSEVSAGVAASSSTSFCATFSPYGGPEGVLPALLTESPDRLALQPLFVESAEQYGVSPALLEAIAWQESGWQEGVVSSAAAVGIGQLIPSTAEFIDDDLIGQDLDPTQAADNIEMSAAFLGYLSQVEDGNLCDIIAAYYEGPQNLAAYGVFAMSEPYVESVEALLPDFE
jgi:N-acetylmuramoyl-L-alanine amidase